MSKRMVVLAIGVGLVFTCAALVIFGATIGNFSEQTLEHLATPIIMSELGVEAVLIAANNPNCTYGGLEAFERLIPKVGASIGKVDWGSMSSVARRRDETFLLLADMHSVYPKECDSILPWTELQRSSVAAAVAGLDAVVAGDNVMGITLLEHAADTGKEAQRLMDKWSKGRGE